MIYNFTFQRGYIHLLFKPNSKIYIFDSIKSTSPFKGFSAKFNACSCVESKIKSSTTVIACPTSLSLPSGTTTVR